MLECLIAMSLCHTLSSTAPGLLLCWYTSPKYRYYPSTETTLLSRMLRYWPCRAWQAPRTLLWLGGGGVQQPSSPRECPAARGLSLLSQVKLWKPQPLITAWHRAPSGFRVACIDSRSLHWTWVWAKFKPCHRQFNSFLWGGNLMVNHNYRYNWYLNSQNNLWRCVEFKSVQLEFHLLIIKYSIIANCPLAHHILRQKFGVVF